MHTVHLGAFDLNLLTAFDALWSERSVTRAARRVGLTQSALSHALQRLRAQLDDPLFQPTPGGMMPTARAQALAGPVADALAGVRRALEAPRPFDPRRLERTFTVGTSDYSELVLLPRLLARLEREAPGLSLVVRPVGPRSDRDLLSGAHDLGITPGGHTDGELRSQELFTERFVCILRKGHPLARKRLTVERFVKLSHVLIAPENVGDAPVDVALRAIGRARRVTVRVPHFLVAPLVVAESDHVLTLPERVVQALGAARFSVHAPPIPVPGFAIHQHWHPRNDADPGHRWFRELVAEIARRRGP
jgi:DNA-binding transcriptional LysR family regulator